MLEVKANSDPITHIQYYRPSGQYLQNKKLKEKNEKNTKTIPIKLKFKPKRGQKAIMEMVRYPSVKKIVLNIFRQYGKSYVCRYLILYWMQQKNVTVGYITQTGRLAKDIYKKFVNLFPDELIKAKDGKDFIIELTNGSKLIFFSVEQTHAIRGFTLDYLIWDEVAHSREYTPDGEHIYYNIVAPLMDAKGKKEIFISTPNGKRGFFYEMAMKAMSGEDKSMRYMSIAVNQDETKTQDWIDEKIRQYPERAFRQEYMVEFLDEGGSYFSNFSERFTLIDFDWNGRIYCGVDFSSVGEDDTVVTFMNDKGEAIQYVISGDLDSKYSQVAGLLKRCGKNLVHSYFESNSIGQPMANEIKKLLPIYMRERVEMLYTSNSSKQDYIELLALDIQQENVSFMKDNEVLFDQFQTFICTKSKTGKNVYAAMPGLHDDMVISLALANYSRYKHRNRSTNKSIMVVRR